MTETTKSFGISQESVNETDNKNYFEREEMEGTPFSINYDEKHGYYATMRNYRVTDAFQTKKGLENYINRKPWKLLSIVIAIAAETVAQIEIQKDKTDNKIN